MEHIHGSLYSHRVNSDQECGLGIPVSYSALFFNRGLKFLIVLSRFSFEKRIPTLIILPSSL